MVSGRSGDLNQSQIIGVTVCSDIAGMRIRIKPVKEIGTVWQSHSVTDHRVCLNFTQF